MTIGSNRAPYRCFAKLFVTWCARTKLLRLGRLVWARGTPGQPGGGYSAKLSIALTPRLFSWKRELLGEWMLTICGLRIHHQRSYGGWIA